MRKAEVSIKAWSPSALLAAIGHTTKHTTVTWHWHIHSVANKKGKTDSFSKIITELNLYIR